MAYLALVRHGQSEWNQLGLWTGLTDVTLNDIGREEAARAAAGIGDVRFDVAFTSTLQRAQETLDVILTKLGQKDVPIIRDAALNERNYGDLTGKNKWAIREEFGEEQFLKWRRSWDYPIPNGESLKDVYERVVPYYTTHILPELAAGKNVIVVAHGNSLRALVKYLEAISDEMISALEIGTAEVYLYDVAPDGKIVDKQIRAVNTNVV
ncbi:MAG: 2,3-bisphosphoglycerate-dependent phosphoglycerate mutase [Chloroflexota bacterium]|nr:2,3-bisphosphoglycerate-dependent phosphoglycerate mutase [Chloroflexota bacterium]